MVCQLGNGIAIIGHNCQSGTAEYINESGTAEYINETVSGLSSMGGASGIHLAGHDIFIIILMITSMCMLIITMVCHFKYKVSDGHPPLTAEASPYFITDN
jgi:hypothetical protein